MLIIQVTTALGLSTLLAAAIHSQAPSSKAEKSCTPESLVGRYEIVDGEKEGTKEPAERIKGTTVTITKDSIVVADKDKKEIYTTIYKLDATTNPCSITMTSRVESSAGEIARGLIQKDGNTVRLIYALPTGEIPTGFTTKEKQLMFVMKKME
jgi:uncharacterized protein (TIGR03067 family)